MQILVVLQVLKKYKNCEPSHGGVMKQTFTSTNTYNVSHATMVYYNRKDDDDLF